MNNGAQRGTYDAVIVGSGPNGLGAAITLAREGLRVLILEAEETIGGGARSAELTLPGFLHDRCSAIHPLAVASPFFRDLSLAEYGLQWIHPPTAVAHPLDDRTAVLLERSVSDTAHQLGSDGPAYQQLVEPLVATAEQLFGDILGPLRWPRHLRAAVRFAGHAVRSAEALARRRFVAEPARALLAGLAAHSFLPLEQAPSAAVALVLAIAGHSVGWPLPRGGAQRITDALCSCVVSLGGEVRTNHRVTAIEELPAAQAVLLDLTPRQVLSIAGHRLPSRYRRALQRYRYGPAAFKVDWALCGPIPWKAAECARAGTVHVGGTFGEIAASERSVWRGLPPERPFVLVAQQSLFDSSRAPENRQVAWGYCHVPNGSSYDMTDRIEAQIERFAPGFRDCILDRRVTSPAGLECQNSNCIGGDINGGVQDFRQLFTRPTVRLVPYSTPLSGLFICSASTPPGGGVHGMCGYFAARAALRSAFGKSIRRSKD